MKEIKTNRQTWVDFARGIAIILVLYRHVFEGIKSSGIPVGDYLFLEHFNIIFFSFRMPLFFIVSGIFLSASFAKRGLRRYIDVKARIILFPYFLWGALQITLKVFFEDYTNYPRGPFDYVYLIYQPREIGQFWYLYTLFHVSVLYVLFKYVIKLRHWHQFTLGLIFYYFAAYCHRKGINLGFLLDVFSYYIFIVLGDAIHKVVRDPKNIKKFESWKVAGILVIPFFASQLYFLYENLNHFSGSRYTYVEYYQPSAFLLICLVGCAFVISVCFLLQKAGRYRWLRTIGTQSLNIYVAHVIVFASVRAFMINILHITNVPLLLLSGIISGLFIPILMFHIAKRLNVEWIFGLKEKPGRIQKPDGALMIAKS